LAGANLARYFAPIRQALCPLYNQTKERLSKQKLKKLVAYAVVLGSLGLYRQWKATKNRIWLNYSAKRFLKFENDSFNFIKRFSFEMSEHKNK
jgi:hypothetical protein